MSQNGTSPLYKGEELNSGLISLSKAVKNRIFQKEKKKEKIQRNRIQNKG